MPFSFDISTFVLPGGGSGALVGYCDLVIDGKLQVKGFKVFKSKKDDELFIGAPSQPGKKPDENGKTVYYETIRFLDEKENEKDWHTPFQREVYDAMLVEFKKAMEEGRGSTPTAGGGTKGRAPVADANGGPARAGRSNPLWKGRNTL